MSTSPRLLGKYELQAQLGHGGTAEVWRARDTKLQRYVAIKLLHADLQEDSQFVTRFEHEAQLVASLHHPNIVQVHDFQVVRPPEVEHTLAYMVMEYIEGQTLADYMQNTSRRGNIPGPADIVHLFTSIALAVDYAHHKGLVHRDLKPANILLDKRNTERNPMGEPVLTDFGVAKMLGTASGALTAAQLSTPLYISPEQVGGYPGNERSDLYALGVILYEVVTGVLPFHGDNPTEVMNQHLHATPVSPAVINPNVPPPLTMVILRCLAKDPDSRFPSASSMAAALAESLNIPVPESLGQPAYPVGTTDMPTRVGPLPDVSKASSPPPVGTVTPSATPMSRQTPVTNTPYVPSSSVGAQTPAARTPNQTPPLQSSGVLSDRGSPATPALAGSSQYSQPGISAFTPVQTPPGVQTPRAPFPVGPFRTPANRRRTLYIGLAALVILVLLGSVISYFVFLRPSGPPVPATGSVVGHAYYTSSGQLRDREQGIADQMQIDIQNVSPPPAGKSYYAWLLGDKPQSKPIGAGKDLLIPPPIQAPVLVNNNLPVRNGEIHYFYSGDAQHNNVLSVTSRFLITLEDAGRTPRAPSADRSTWIYYAQLPQMLIPGDPTNLRGLDHVRHIFYNEDHLPVLALYGGLDIWIFRNTEKVLEWSTSARDDFDPTGKNYDLMHSLFVQSLDYLDGSPNVHLDIPPSTNTPILADPNTARVSLLTVSPEQASGKFLDTNPPGDLDHLTLHLQQAIRAPDATPAMRALAQEILDAITHAKVWLTQVRKDAKALFDMSPQQLSQPAARAILDDMVTQATYAYIGQLDPTVNKVIPGILQAHYDNQKLATFDITRQVPNTL